MKIKILFATAALVLSAGTAVAYDNAGDCSDAVVDSCNGKYEGGDALESCVNSGVKQCLKAYPDSAEDARPNPASLKLKGAPGQPQPGSVRR